jgi:hypothetical protein
MVTRFYLPSTGEAPITPAYDAGWTRTSEVARQKMLTAKINSAFGNQPGFSSTGAGAEYTLLKQYISDPLTAQTITGTVKAQMKCKEMYAAQNATLAIGIRVVSYDGDTVRGTLLAITASDKTDTTPPEFATSDFINRRFLNAAESTPVSLSSVVAQNGDRLIVEIGFREENVNQQLAAITFGDNSPNDLPEDDTSTSLYNPWIEFSQTLTFSKSTTVAVDDTTLTTAIASGPQHRVFYICGRWWVFYSDGTDIVFRTSTNYSTWSGKTPVLSGISNMRNVDFDIERGKYGADYGLFFIHCIWHDGVNGDPLKYKRGEMKADGTITWSADQTIETQAGLAMTYPAIRVSSESYPAVIYQLSQKPRVAINANRDGTWSNRSGYPQNLSETTSSTHMGTITRLSAGKLVFFYFYNAAIIRCKEWDPSGGLSGPIDVSSSTIASAFYVGVSGFLQNDESRIVFNKSSSNNLIAITKKWNTAAEVEVIIRSGSSSSTCPCLIVISNGDEYVFYAISNHIYYLKYSAVAKTWDAEVDWLDESTATLPAGHISGCYVHNGMRCEIVYLTDNASPYTIKAAELPLYVSKLSTQRYTIGPSLQRKACRALSRDWLFYCDGTDIAYNSTPDDGKTWKGSAVAKNSPGINGSKTFAMWHDRSTDYVHCVFSIPTYNNALQYRRGLLVSDGSIDWTSDWVTVIAADATKLYITPYITIDSSGYPWISWTEYRSGDNKNRPLCCRSTTNDGTWTTASGFPKELDGAATYSGSIGVVLAFMTNRDIMAIWSITGAKVRTSKYTYSTDSWAAPADTSAQISDRGTALSCTSNGNNVHVAYRWLNGSTAEFRHMQYNGSSWLTEAVIAGTLGTGGMGISLISVPSVNDLIAIYVKDTGGASGSYGESYYYQLYQSGAWGSESLFADEWLNAILYYDNFTCGYVADLTSSKVPVFYEIESGNALPLMAVHHVLLIPGLPKPIEGYSWLKATTSKEIEGYANIKAITEKNISGYSWLKQTGASQEISGSAHIKQVGQSKTIGGYATLKHVSSQQVSGNAHIKGTTTQEISGMAEIWYGTVQTRTIDGYAWLKTLTERQISGEAWLKGMTSQQISGYAALSTAASQQISGYAQIKGESLQQISGNAHLKTSTEREISGYAWLVSAGYTLQTIIGNAWLKGITQKEISGYGFIKNVVTAQVISGMASISGPESEPLLIESSITQVVDIQSAVSQLVTIETLVK